MKKFKSKKQIILPILAVASLSMSSLALAYNNNYLPNNNMNNYGNISGPHNNSPTNNPPSDDSDIIAAIKDLGNKMVGLGFAGMTAFNQAMYQFDQNLLNILNANTASAAVDQTTVSTGSTNTAQYIKNSFVTVPNLFLSTSEDAMNADTISDQIKKENQLTNNLTLGVPASDTLYINEPDAIYQGYNSFTPAISTYYNSSQKYTIGPPPINDDNYFSISSLLEISSYSSDQLNAANIYLAYLTQSYQSLASGLNLSELKGYINSLKSDQQSAALYKFVSGSEYQTYQLALRSYMANKSIAINNFEHLISERTPSKTKVTGIYDNKGNAISNPSQLQVEQYQANNRINNPAWIQSLQSMSSASLQREVAVELAQIIQQNQQAHMDNERIITTLSALLLQSSQSSAMTLNTDAQQVNQVISNLTGSSSSSSSSSSSDSSNTNSSSSTTSNTNSTTTQNQQQTNNTNNQNNTNNTNNKNNNNSSGS